MITLVKADTKEDRKMYAPLPLLYAGGALKRAGYDVNIYHCDGEEDAKKHAETILNYDPMFIGFSVITGVNTLYAVKISKEIKQLAPEKLIVWGGVHPSLSANECMREDYIDIAVIGEGERTLVELADAIKNKKPLDNVKGITFKKNSHVVFTQPRELIQNLDAECKADWSLVNAEDYFRALPAYHLKRTINIITSRGCPYQCGFCYNLNFNERRWRAHSIPFVLNEIQFLKDNYDIDGLFFFDDLLFANKLRALEIIKKANMPYFAEVRIDNIDEKLAREMGQTRCVETLLGIESGCDRILRLMNKGFTVKQTKQGVAYMDKYKVPMGFSFILGFPTETWPEACETIRFIADSHDQYPQISDTIGSFLPFPGTPLYDIAVKYGFQPPEKMEDWDLLDRQHGQLDFGMVTWGSHDLFAYIRQYGKFASFYAKLHPRLARIATKKLRELSEIPEEDIKKFVNFGFHYKALNWVFQELQFKHRNRIMKYKIARDFYAYWRKRFITQDTFIYQGESDT